MTGSDIKRIAYYISAHGYGHAVRSVAVLAQLTQNHHVHIKTEIPAEFFKLHLNSPFSLTKEKVDAGCAQKDSIQVDAEQSFRNLANFYRDAAACRREALWLKENRIDLVVSDIASRPLKAAKELGLPSVLIANFTWHDIYSHFPEADRQTALIDMLREEYACAHVQILPQCHLQNDVIPVKQEVGFIAQKGADVRTHLEEELSISLKDKILIFIYLGESGKSEVNWKNLEALEHCRFITRDPLLMEHGIPSNLIILNERFLYRDLIASSDIVCTKAGYSTLATAFVHDKPVITCSREHFFEFTAVRDFFAANQIGEIIDNEPFYSGQWADSIKKVREITVKDKVRLDGATETRCVIESFL